MAASRMAVLADVNMSSPQQLQIAARDCTRTRD
jgi:hypothetical protein